MNTYLFSNHFLRCVIAFSSFLWVCIGEVKSAEWLGNIGESYYTKADIRGVRIKFQTDLKLDTLVGEPVVSLAFRWQVSESYTDLSFSKFEVPSFGKKLGEVNSISLLNIDENALGKINIIDVDVLVEFSFGAWEKYYMVIDAGAIAKGDGNNWSFNPPGSPAWGKLLLRYDPRQNDVDLDDASHYFDASKARRAFKKILNDRVRVNASIYKAKMSFYDLQNWYVRNNPKPEIELLKSNIAALETGISSAFGFEFKKSTEDMIGAMKLPEDIGKLRELYEKLENLPAEFTEEGNSDIYSSTVSDAKLRFIQFENWESSEEKYIQSKAEIVNNEPKFSVDDNDHLLVNGVNACETKYVVCKDGDNGYTAYGDWYIGFNKYIIVEGYDKKIYIKDMISGVRKEYETRISKEETEEMVSQKVLWRLRADAHSIVLLEITLDYIYSYRGNKRTLSHLRARDCYHYIADANLNFQKKKIELNGSTVGEKVLDRDFHAGKSSYFNKCMEGKSEPIGVNK